MAHFPYQPASTANIEVVDIEDVFLQSNRKQSFRARGLRVTDITSSHWCQLQTTFKLHLPKLFVVTRPMTIGTKRHRQLEAQVHEFTEVIIETREDYWAIALLNSIVTLQTLQTQGLARELFVYGWINGVCLTGSVDELRLVRCNQCQRDSIQVVENKTRHLQSKVPREQRAGALLQASLYKSLLDGFAASTSPDSARRFLKTFRLHPNRILSRSVQAWASSFLALTPTRLTEVLHSLHTALKAMPGTSSCVQVRYELPGTQSDLVSAVPFNSAWLHSVLQTQLAFWLGESAPAPVPDNESWKCNTCPYRQLCFRKRGKNIEYAA